MEAAVEDELRDLVVVRHVVTRVVGDDQVGPGGAHEVDDEPALIRVRRVDLAVPDPESGVLGTADLGRPASLVAPDAGDLLGGVHVAAAVTPRCMTHDDFVSLPDEADERPATENLEIVRVGADGEHAH